MSTNQNGQSGEVFDFKNTETAKPMEFLQPGEYMMKIVDVKLGQNKTQSYYAAITLETKDTKQKMTDKFHLTENALSRVKYLYVAYMDKEQFDEVITGREQLVRYLKDAFTSREIYKPFIVGGDIDPDDNTKVYSKLPWAGFILDVKDFKGDRAYEVGSKEYQAVVKKQKLDKKIEGKNSTVISNGQRPTGTGAKKIWDEDPS